MRRTQVRSRPFSCVGEYGRCIGFQLRSFSPPHVSGRRSDALSRRVNVLGQCNSEPSSRVFNLTTETASLACQTRRSLLNMRFQQFCSTTGSKQRMAESGRMIDFHSLLKVLSEPL